MGSVETILLLVGGFCGTDGEKTAGLGNCPSFREGWIKKYGFVKRRHNKNGVIHKPRGISTEIKGFSTKLCHLSVMSGDGGLACFVVEPLSDLKQVAEQGSVSVDIAANLLVSVEDSAVVSTSELVPDLGPGALQFLPEKVHRHLACHGEGFISSLPLKRL